LTEPDHGSDPGGMQTKARDMGDHFLISGSKNWITNSPVADVFIIWAVKQIMGLIHSINPLTTGTNLAKSPGLCIGKRDDWIDGTEN